MMIGFWVRTASRSHKPSASTSKGNHVRPATICWWARISSHSSPPQIRPVMVPAGSSKGSRRVWSRSGLGRRHPLRLFVGRSLERHGRRSLFATYVQQRTDVLQEQGHYRCGVRSTLHDTLLTSEETAMALRNFTLASSRAYRGGYATDGLRADAVERSYFPDALVSILDVDLSYEDAFEPDGVNDFVRRRGSEELDQQ